MDWFTSFHRSSFLVAALDDCESLAVAEAPQTTINGHGTVGVYTWAIVG